MPKITMVFGFLLCLLSVIILAITGKVGSISIFIPCFVGVPLILLGFLANQMPSKRMHIMHAAVTFGLLGALAALGRGIPKALEVVRGEEVDWLAVSTVWAMILICVTYVLVCVESFISARKARKAAEGTGSSPA